jgi:hypothetical protein
VVTDYTIITDDDVCGGGIVDMDVCFSGCLFEEEGGSEAGSDKGTGSGKGGGGYSSDAHAIESVRVAVIQTDGTDDGVSDIHQDAVGNQTIYTYNHFCAGSVGTGPLSATFHDDIYCNPMRDATPGCAVATAPNPVLGDTDIFDYVLDTSCNGSNSIAFLVSYFGRIGECGLPMAQSVGILGSEDTSLNQLAQLMDAASPVMMNGDELLMINLNKNTVSGTISLRDKSNRESSSFALDMGQANIRLYLQPGIGLRGTPAIMWDARDAEAGVFLADLADMVDNGEQGVPFRANLTVAGVPIKLGHGDYSNLAFAPDALRRFAADQMSAGTRAGAGRSRNSSNLSNPHLDANRAGLR